MNYTKLFEIEWDDSYNDPDFSVPGTCNAWLDAQGKDTIERLALHMEWLANRLRSRKEPFGHCADYRKEKLAQ